MYRKKKGDTYWTHIAIRTTWDDEEIDFDKAVAGNVFNSIDEAKESISARIEVINEKFVTGILVGMITGGAIAFLICAMIR